MIKNSLKETVDINKDANPVTLWEVIKGNIRNETIKYASAKKKRELTLEKQLLTDIDHLETEISEISLLPLSSKCLEQGAMTS